MAGLSFLGAQAVVPLVPLTVALAWIALTLSSITMLFWLFFNFFSPVSVLKGNQVLFVLKNKCPAAARKQDIQQQECHLGLMAPAEHAFESLLHCPVIGAVPSLIGKSVQLQQMGRPKPGSQKK